MGAGASAKEAPLESSDPEEQAVYARLKARYDGESPALGSDVERDALYATLKKEYDQWLSDGHDAHPHAISAGDVVQAPVDGLYFEGVVTHVDAEGAHVDFGTPNKSKPKIHKSRKSRRRRRRHKACCHHHRHRVEPVTAGQESSGPPPRSLSSAAVRTQRPLAMQRAATCASRIYFLNKGRNFFFACRAETRVQYE